MSSPDDRSAGDDFDELVLDDSFVAGATINEKSAADRQPKTPPPPTSINTGRKRRRLKRATNRVKPARRRNRAPRAGRLSRGHSWMSSSGSSSTFRPPPEIRHPREWTLAQWLTTTAAAALLGVGIWLGVQGGSHHTQPPTSPSVPTTNAPGFTQGTPPATSPNSGVSHQGGGPG